MREPLITLGSAPLENPYFRAALFEQLGSSELEVPVTTDIAGKKDAHGLRLDKEATEQIKRANCTARWPRRSFLNRTAA